MVGCCKLSLYANESCDEHAIYFRRWLKWRAIYITFSMSGNDVISLESRSLNFHVFIHMYTAELFLVVTNRRTKSVQEQIRSINVDKVGSKTPLASKSCFL